MNRSKIWLLSFLLTFVGIHAYSQVAGSGKANSDTFTHTIERGQTVYAIATMYGVTPEDIYKLNPNSKTVIKIGDKLIIPQKRADLLSTQEQAYTFHTIAPKETLYSLSRSNNVTPQQIIEENPGLTAATFKIGRTIRIPQSSASQTTTVIKEVKKPDIEYKIKKKETLFSIGRAFHVTPEALLERNPELKSGVKAGQIIFIPSPVEITEIATESLGNEAEINALLNQTIAAKRVSATNVALLLPFMSKDPGAAVDPSNARFIEYYEGFLLAVDSLKKKGQSINLYVYDTNKNPKTTADILRKEEMKKMNLIVGAVYNEQINLIANFAQKNNIKYVIPFTSKNDNVLNNPDIFQVNTPQSYLYSKASQAFSTLYANHNVVILKMPQDKDSKDEFISELKSELDAKKMEYQTCTYNSENFSETLLSYLSDTKPNVIIPTTSSAEALSRFLAPLKSIKDSKPEYTLSLFGYPDWQVYTKEYLDKYYALDTYIYSNFYANNLSSQVKEFYNKFKVWYSKSLYVSYPRYGMLGFDTGMYFLNAINLYGTNFENNLSKINYKSLQTGFNFERVNTWGGFINTNLFIINYRPDYSVSVSEFRTND